MNSSRASHKLSLFLWDHTWTACRSPNGNNGYTWLPWMVAGRQSSTLSYKKTAQVTCRTTFQAFAGAPSALALRLCCTYCKSSLQRFLKFCFHPQVIFYFKLLCICLPGILIQRSHYHGRNSRCALCEVYHSFHLGTARKIWLRDLWFSRIKSCPQWMSWNWLLQT